MTLELSRRRALATGLATTLARPAIAQGKPSRLVFLCVNGGWGSVLYDQAIPEFEKATGIKIEPTILPADGLAIRLRAELIGKSGGVDISMWNPPWAGWLAPHMSDHDALLAKYGSTADDTDWKDIYAPAIAMASFKSKKIGLPYRVVANVLYYQPQVLQDAGFAKPPRTYAEMLDAAKRITANGGGKRFGVGYMGKVSVFIVGGFEPYLYSYGGDFYDQSSYEVLINKPAAVEALQYFGDLLTVHKVVPPEVITWNTDEVIAGAQTDRYAMTLQIGPWATQIDGNGPADAGKWATEGKWAYAPVPGGTTPDSGRSAISGWAIGVPDGSPNQEWAFRFLQHITNKKWFAKSIEGGNMPPAAIVATDADLAARYPWAAETARSLKTAFLEPRDDIWPTLNARLAVGISEVLSKQKTAKAALDDVAADWDRQMKRARLK